VSDIKLEFWEEIFLKTTNETDPLKLAQPVPEAELAMFKRELDLYNRPQNSEEQSTLCIASEALRVVGQRITKPGFLGPSKGNPARFANFVRRS